MHQGRPLSGWTGEIDLGGGRATLEGRRADRNVGLSTIGSSLREIHLAASHHDMFTPFNRRLVKPPSKRISHHTRRATTCNKTKLRRFRPPRSVFSSVSMSAPHVGPHVGLPPLNVGPHFGPRPISVPMSGLCCIVGCIMLYGELCCVVSHTCCAAWLVGVGGCGCGVVVGGVGGDAFR